MKRFWMRFNVPHYLADTLHLTTVEHGAYMLLIMHYWQAGGLPNDDEKLARIARATSEEWTKLRPTVAMFFDDQWRHKRIDAEIAKIEVAQAAGRKAGLASAAARKKTQSTNGQRIGNENSTIVEKSLTDRCQIVAKSLQRFGNKTETDTEKERKKEKKEDRARFSDAARASGSSENSVGDEKTWPEATALPDTAEKLTGNRLCLIAEPLKNDLASSTGSLIRPEAFSTAQDCLRAIGFQTMADAPPAWAGLSYQVETMLARGIPPPLIVSTFGRLRASQKPPAYFYAAVNGAHADAQKPQEVTTNGRIENNDRSALAALRLIRSEMDSGPDRNAPIGLPER